MRTLLTLLIVAALSVTGTAQFSLTTTLASGNGQNGAMFDITNISGSTVFITSFDQAYFGTGTSALYEVYAVTAGTTFVGNETNAGAWTLQGSTTGVAHPAAAPTTVPIPIVLSIAIPPGATQGIYCTTSADTIAYTNGLSPVGTVFASDANIQFRIGVGKSYPFGATFTPRVWNGIINYSLGTPPPPLFETNSAGSSLDFNGVQGTAFSKAVTSVCTGATVTANSGGTTGLPWEAAFNFAATVPATSPFSITTPGGQIVNLDLSAGITFFNGGAVPVLLPYIGPFSLSFTAPGAALTLAFQQLNIDPSASEGFSLSQAPQLNVVAASLPAGPIAGPAGDDTQVQVPVGCITAWGRSFSDIFIESNGRLMFGGGITTFTPSVAQFLTDFASFGIWSDFNPANLIGGTPGVITYNILAAGVIDVSYANVSYFGAPTVPNNFNLQIDTNTGILSIIGLTGLGAGTAQQLIGASGGSAVGATNPGPVAYSPATTGTTGNGTDIIHAIGTQGGVAPGINRIDFFPNVYNNYDWVSQ